MSLKEPRFKDNKDGVTSVNADISLITGDGKTLMSRLRMDYVNDTPFLVEFSQIQVDGISSEDPISFDFKMPLIPKVDFYERLNSLKESIGD